MSTSVLRSTQFRVLKLRSNGSDGRAAPYQVTTFRGRKLGIVGTLPRIEIRTDQEAANQATFDLTTGQRLRYAFAQLATAR